MMPRRQVSRVVEAASHDTTCTLRTDEQPSQRRRYNQARQRNRLETHARHGAPGFSLAQREEVEQGETRREPQKEKQEMQEDTQKETHPELIPLP
jgi:hypothetical protein